ncbi:hypothetical protein GcM3_100013 [Golovinomyces cichoracearum]|uniref:Uncharacterized protein n=1 Tax=Golovinomyces cichoracearum TaxID=62708 RepID=A0A420IAI5_9PEZI|nr:hypothetical protein GcM3_100013 [Golovinomyces cichoracearum]
MTTIPDMMQLKIIKAGLIVPTEGVVKTTVLGILRYINNHETSTLEGAILIMGTRVEALTIETRLFPRTGRKNVLSVRNQTVCRKCAPTRNVENHSKCFADTRKTIRCHIFKHSL